MSSDGFDKLLAESDENAREPASVTFLRELLGMGFSIKRLSFRRDRDHFSLGEPVYILALDRAGNPRLERIEWSRALEALLHEKGIKAETAEQEAGRGAYRMVQDLRGADRKWGKDYTDCVLNELLASLFDNSEDVKALLAEVPLYRPSKGEAYTECLGYLRGRLAEYATSLIDALHYTREEAQNIFTKAILAMFDERHHLTLTRLLLTGT